MLLLHKLPSNPKKPANQSSSLPIPSPFFIGKPNLLFDLSSLDLKHSSLVVELGRLTEVGLQFWFILVRTVGGGRNKTRRLTPPAATRTLFASTRYVSLTAETMILLLALLASALKLLAARCSCVAACCLS